MPRPSWNQGSHYKTMRFMALAIIILIFSGCSVLEQTHSKPETDDTIRGTAGELAEKFQLHDVPHNPRKQKGTDCAPDSLRMILNYRGKKISNDQEITRLLTSRGRSGGTSFSQMQDIAVKHYGLPAFRMHNCNMDSIKSAIMNKWPPIVSYRSSGRSYHAVVAVGYDDKRHTMFVHDPNYQRVRKIRYDDLGGVSGDSDQKLACLVILPEGATEETLRRGLRKYIPAESVEKLRIFAKLPQGN